MAVARTLLGSLAVVALLAGVAYRLRSRLGGGLPGRRRDRSEEFRCDCGQRFRVSGAGRHRIYWLTGADEADPVLEAACPECSRPLPSG